MSSTWSGINDGEPWVIEVETDRFAEGQPCIVSIFTKQTDCYGDHETLAAPDADQARGIAAALVAYADMADRANALDRSNPIGSTWTPKKRACTNCGAEHEGLIDWTDGVCLCVRCDFDRMRADETTGEEQS